MCAQFRHYLFAFLVHIERPFGCIFNWSFHMLGGRKQCAHVDKTWICTFWYMNDPLFLTVAQAAVPVKVFYFTAWSESLWCSLHMSVLCCHLTAFFEAIYIEFWYLYFCRYQNICLYSGDFVFYTVSGTVVNPDPKVRSSKGYTMRHCAVLLNMTSIWGFATDT